MTAIEEYAIGRLYVLVEEANAVFYRGGPSAFPGYSQTESPTGQVMGKLTEMKTILNAIMEDD